MIQNDDACAYENYLEVHAEGVCEDENDCTDDRLALASRVGKCGSKSTGKMCCPLPASGENSQSD